MPGPTVDAVRDFALQLEKAMTFRRLYAPTMAMHQEAASMVLERLLVAAAGSEFRLRLGPADLYFGKASVLHRPKPEDAFFFPLYRDGLRELRFSSAATVAAMEALLAVFEAEDKRSAGALDDSIGRLWRAELVGISYLAIDGLESGDSSAGADPALGDFPQAIAAFVDEMEAARMGEPAHGLEPASLAPELAARLGTLGSAVEAQLATLRREWGARDEPALIARFVEILLHLLVDPERRAAPEAVTHLLGHVLEGHWSRGDRRAALELLGWLRRAAESAPDPAARQAAAERVAAFASIERLGAILAEVVGGSFAFAEATRLWDLAGDGAWLALLEAWSGLPENEARQAIAGYLRRRAGSDPSLLRRALREAEAKRVRAALQLLDEPAWQAFREELMALAGHADDGIRARGLTFAARLGGEAALETIWRAMEADPSSAVRSAAFRLLSDMRVPGLARRLENLLRAADFEARPAWEREKFVRLFGVAAGTSARTLFESWLPQKRWMWQARDHERAQLAMTGLIATGPEGRTAVERYAAEKGSMADAATKALEAWSTRRSTETKA